MLIHGFHCCWDYGSVNGSIQSVILLAVGSHTILLRWKQSKNKTTITDYCTYYSAHLWINQIGNKTIGHICHFAFHSTTYIQMQSNMSVVSIAWKKIEVLFMYHLHKKNHFFFTAETRYVPLKTKLVKCSDSFRSLIVLGLYGFLLFVLCFPVVFFFSSN